MDKEKDGWRTAVCVLYKPKRPPLPGADKLVLLAGIELATY